jgi:hypothetical protein
MEVADSCTDLATKVPLIYKFILALAHSAIPAHLKPIGLHGGLIIVFIPTN